jgi:hypothetical protein
LAIGENRNIEDLRNRKGQNPGGTTQVMMIQIQAGPRETLSFGNKSRGNNPMEDVALGKKIRTFSEMSD